ncbi:MAG: helical backbone metal receptor, partial [Gammaproteobacteria bacterium]
MFAETLESPRVVSLAPALTELVFAAGAGNTLVGVVEYSDYPKEALEIPRVGDAFRIDVERVLAMEPDIVLAWPSGNPAPMLEQLESLGLRVEL